MKKITALLICLLMSGCKPNTTEPVKDDPVVIGPVEKKLASDVNKFGYNIFRLINKSSEGKNTFISPVSISWALGMTMNGASGNTLTEMQDVLGFSTKENSEINQAYSMLIKYLPQADASVELGIANSIWAKEGVDFIPEFLETNKKFFEAEVISLDFTKASSVKTINDWVSANTKGKIESIIDRLDPSAVMMLINAVYFKGIWKYEFDKKDTYKSEFHNYDLSKSKIDMMQRTAQFFNSKDSLCRYTQMSYGNGKFSMGILLPNEGIKLTQLQDKLDDGYLNMLISSGKTSEVEVHFPRIELNYDNELNDELIGLGMPSAFDGGKADFSRLINSEVFKAYIGLVKHKSYLKIDEKGTEAAAVTSVEIRLTSIGPSGAFIVDRPFIFVIREETTGVILFMGKIEDLNL